MTDSEFEKLVAQALEDLPTFFKEKVENVEIVIENWPSPTYSKGGLLLGLYHGVPKTRRGAGYTMVLPDKITIFKSSIELLSGGDPQVSKKLVTDTVQHEIAHHFGISDARLRQLKKG